MFDFILNKLPLLLLIGVGLYLAGWTILKDLLFPDHIGTVLGLPDLLHPDGPNGCCSWAEGGFLPLQVKLDNEEVVQAEVSPCSLCMDSLKPGDRVSVNRIRHRLMARRAPTWRIKRC
ncbi:MAG: hypothetical protein JRJ71_12930 [Deltaproteobacteria bacterium]|nr:hypothetical protein [Deltaproteobacteria bacterium]